MRARTVPPLPPLVIRGLPTIGPGGDRDNIERLHTIHSALLPPGRVLVMDVAHDNGCPCEAAGAPLPACTCPSVDVTLRLHDPRQS